MSGRDDEVPPHSYLIELHLYSLKMALSMGFEAPHVFTSENEYSGFFRYKLLPIVLQIRASPDLSSGSSGLRAQYQARSRSIKILPSPPAN